MDISVNPEFAAWAKGFSGCDGGNIKGPVWFCGIEYGGIQEEQEFHSADVAEPGFINDLDLKEKLLRYQYGRKTAKLYSALTTQKVANYDKIANEHKLFAQSSNAFRMNLYPVAFVHDDDELWAEWLYRKTGLPTKSMYRAWCQAHRFAEIRRWTRENSPRLIVGTGLSCRNEFLLAFDGVDNLFTGGFESLPIGDRQLYWRTVNDGQTILAVTPFLGGRYGLNSDALLQDFGRALSGICHDRFGADWLPSPDQH